MPTCTDIENALNTLASATTNPNVIDDLSGTTAILSGLTATVPSPVQLTAGGNAVLSVPSSLDVNGRMFRIVVAGLLYSPTSTTTMESILSFVSPAINIGTGSERAFTTANFFITADCLWDSTTQVLRYVFISTSANASGSLTPTTGTITGIATQSDIQFIVQGVSNPSFPNPADPTDSLAITQFKAILL